MSENKLTNGLIASVVPIILVGLGTIVVQIFDIKECMARMEERLKNHIEYHDLVKK